MLNRHLDRRSSFVLWVSFKEGWFASSGHQKKKKKKKKKKKNLILYVLYHIKPATKHYCHTASQIQYFSKSDQKGSVSFDVL
jgi:hypothetical protein